MAVQQVLPGQQQYLGQLDLLARRPDSPLGSAWGPGPGTCRTSSAPARTPHRASWAATRRYPEVPSESSNALVISSLSSVRRFAVALSGLDLHS
jgi:hypothetical protein